MLAIFLMGVLGGAFAIHRAVRRYAHAIPRFNEDLIYV